MHGTGTQHIWNGKMHNHINNYIMQQEKKQHGGARPGSGRKKIEGLIPRIYELTVQEHAVVKEFIKTTIRPARKSR